MTGTTVRQATSHDTESIVALWHELMALHADLVPLVWTLSEDAEARYREHLANMMQDDNRQVLVAEQKEEVVGYVIVEKKTRPPVLAHSQYGVFGEICVAPAARRSGVGEALAAAGVAWFESEGLSVVEVGYAANNPLSVPFWEGQGFRPHMITGVRKLAREDAESDASPEES